MLDFPYKQGQRYLSAEDPAHIRLKHALWTTSLMQPVYCALPSSEQHLDLLMHLTRNSKVLLIVTGEEGLGKTTLLYQAAMQARDFAQVHVVSGAQDFDLKELTRSLLQGFNVAVMNSHQEPMDGLIEQLEQLQQRVNPSVLLVDDAEKLPLETVAALLTLIEYSIDRTIGLRIVLFGRRQLIKNLQHLGTQYPIHDIIHALQLEPLNRAETESYLRFYFEHVLSYRSFPLSNQEVQTIFEGSQGVLLNIKPLVEQYLADHLTSPASAGDRKWSAFIQENAQKIVGAVVLLIIIGGLIIFQGYFSASFHKNTKTVVQSNRPALREGSPDAAQNLIAKPVVTPQLSVAGGVPLQDSRFAEGGVLEAAQLNQERAVPTMLEGSQNMSSMLNGESEHPKNGATPDSKNGGDGELEKVPRAQPQQVQQLSTAVKEKKSSAPPAVKKSSPSSKDKIIATQKSIAAVAIETPKKAIEKGKYSLQLVSVSTEDRAQAFIKAHDFGKKARYMKVKSDGRDLFVVTYGEYPNRQAATRAMEALTKNNADVHPWIKGNV